MDTESLVTNSEQVVRNSALSIVEDSDWMLINLTDTVPGISAPGTSWCGPGQDPSAKDFGGEGDNFCLGSFAGDWACRRHDLCGVAILKEITMPDWVKKMRVWEWLDANENIPKLPVVSCECDKALREAMDDGVPSFHSVIPTAKRFIMAAYNSGALTQTQFGTFTTECIWGLKNEGDAAQVCSGPYESCMDAKKNEPEDIAKAECAKVLEIEKDGKKVLNEACFILKSGTERYEGFTKFGYKPAICKDKECGGRTQQQIRDSKTNWDGCQDPKAVK